MADVAMPRLSDSMEEGTIIKWLKSDGDEIRRGEELVEIETDKANMTYEADSDGVLSIVAQEGDTLEVGAPIARIGAAGESAAEEVAEDTADDAAESPAAEPALAGATAGAEPVGHAALAGAAIEPPAARSTPPAAESAAPTGATDGYGGPPVDASTASSAPAAPSAPAATNGAPPAAPAAAETTTDGNGNGDGRIKASPIARRMAREMDIALGGLSGSGPGGRIVKADIETAEQQGLAGVPAPSAAPATPAVQATPVAPAPAPTTPAAPTSAEAAPTPAAPLPPAPVMADAPEGGTAKGTATRQGLTRMQQIVARRMAESKATAPDFQLTVEIEMQKVVELSEQLRAAAKAGEQTVPSFNDFVIKSAALALRDFPRVNGSYRDGEFELYSRVNIGIAVAGEDTLLVPTIFDADRKTLGAIATDARALAKRARAGALTPPELSGGTFSISNLGMYGIKRFVAVVNPPQAAILAVGAIEPRPVVRDGRVVVRSMMDLTISCDHRILNGADGAEFLVRVRERLEEPLTLLL